MKKINSLTWGLFYKHLPSHWPKDFAIMLDRIHHAIKHGYYPQATFEFYSYQLSMWKEILTWYRDERNGAPIMIPPDEEENWEERNSAVFDNKMNEMLADLAIMERDPLDGKDLSASKEISAEREAAKERFFKAFGEMFYDFWD